MAPPSATQRELSWQDEKLEILKIILCICDRLMLEINCRETAYIYEDESYVSSKYESGINIDYRHTHYYYYYN